MTRRNIVANAVNSADHTTPVAAVEAAGLVGTLSGAGPFTVFAPTDAAFARSPAGTVDASLRPENKAMLQSVLTYHEVPGRLSAAHLMRRIAAGPGRARITTVAGGTLSARMMAAPVILIDGQVGKARFTWPDVMESNETIHVTDSASLPE